MEIFKKEYWSTADTLLLPLTGLGKTETYQVRSYLFWRDYSIFDYQLIITIDYNESYKEIKSYCDNYFFSILDKNATIIESYEIGQRFIVIVDLSFWAKDIEQFIEGKYSKMSDPAKLLIKSFHESKRGKIDQYLWSILYPLKKVDWLSNLSPIEYAAKEYDIPLQNLQDLGEIGNKYDKTAETLFTEIDEICQIGC